MKRTIPFLKYRFVAYTVSFLLLIILASATIGKGGLNWGIDFVGGTKITIKFDKGVTEKDIRNVLKAEFPELLIQQIDSKDKNQYIISTKLKVNQKAGEVELNKMDEMIKKAFPTSKKLNKEAVGPAIGNFLRKSALNLSIFAVLLMMIYLALRFELKYAFAAMIALFHDLILAVLFCGMVGLEINIPIIAALLTIFGYSVNDTIVIFDRIRENVENESAAHFADILNIGISQSVSRTLLTSITTLLAVLSLYYLGGDVISDFALVLLFGIFVGTYSSIYVASPVLFTWNKLFKKK